MISKRVVLVCAILIAALPWMLADVFPIAGVKYPYHCKSQYSLRYINSEDASSVVSDGTMLLSYYKDGTGVGIYTGKILWLDPKGTETKTNSVQRTFEFRYSFKDSILKTETLSATKNLGGVAKDEDVYRYVFPGFRVGHVTYGVLLKIQGGGYTIGNNIYPRALCSPSDFS